MKYGQHLLDNIAPQYGADAYLDYSALDNVIRVLSGYSPASRTGPGGNVYSVASDGTSGCHFSSGRGSGGPVAPEPANATQQQEQEQWSSTKGQVDTTDGPIE
eukprot:scaffold136479_cov40-Attheya_sp.AAC.1